MQYTLSHADTFHARGYQDSEPISWGNNMSMTGMYALHPLSMTEDLVGFWTFKIHIYFQLPEFAMLSMLMFSDLCSFTKFVTSYRGTKKQSTITQCKRTASYNLVNLYDAWNKTIV